MVMRPTFLLVFALGVVGARCSNFGKTISAAVGSSPPSSVLAVVGSSGPSETVVEGDALVLTVDAEAASSDAAVAMAIADAIVYGSASDEPSLQLQLGALQMGAGCTKLLFDTHKH